MEGVEGAEGSQMLMRLSFALPACDVSFHKLFVIHALVKRVGGISYSKSEGRTSRQNLKIPKRRQIVLIHVWHNMK